MAGEADTPGMRRDVCMPRAPRVSCSSQQFPVALKVAVAKLSQDSAQLI